MATRRTDKAIKNAVFGVLSYLILTVSTLITRRVFVAQFDQVFMGYGTELSGVESVFKSIISMMALAELGIGTGLVYLLYKPIADHDDAAICRILNFYKRAYEVVAGIILAIGAVMCLFVSRFTKGTTCTPAYLSVTFFLYMFDTLASYLYAHQRAMMVADQKNYLNNVNEVIMNFLTMVLQVVFLLLVRSFVLYILIRVFCRVMSALLIHRNFKKLYPNLAQNRSREMIDKTQRHQVFSTLYAMLFHKIGGVASHKAGILIIGGVLGAVVNGMYSYYLVITDAVTSLVTQIFSGITASFGDYLTGGDLDAAHDKFNILYYFNFLLSSMCATAILVLVQPFIGLWMGPDKRLGNGVALLVAVYFYLYSLRRVIFVVRDSTGMYRPDRYMPLVETALNVGLGLYWAITKQDIFYVLLANVLSMAVIPLWIQPVMIYKHVFHRNAGGYFARYGLYAALTAAGMAATWFISQALPAMGSIMTLLVRAVLCVAVSAVLYILPFCRTAEFRYLWRLLRSLFHRKRAA